MQRVHRDADFGLRPGESYEPEELVEEEFDPSAPHVMTVLGPVTPDALGVCLPHAHLLCDPGALVERDSDYRLDDRHAMLAELERWAQAGGGTVVDTSTPDYGRDAEGLRWLALRTPIHIIMAAGRHNAQHAERFHCGDTVDDLREEIAREVAHGVGPSGVRPGLIMFGTTLDRIVPSEDIAARAAAQASLETGLPITTHTEAGTMATEQLDVLEREGISPARVILGHLDRRLDPEYLRELLARGVWVSFDQIGTPTYGPDEPKAELLTELVRDGYGGQLLVSLDLDRRSLLPAYGGSPGWTHLLDRFVLLLMEVGMSALDVRRLLVENPATALTVFPPRERRRKEPRGDALWPNAATGSASERL